MLDISCNSLDDFGPFNFTDVSSCLLKCRRNGEGRANAHELGIHAHLRRSRATNDRSVDRSRNDRILPSSFQNATPGLKETTPSTNDSKSEPSTFAPSSSFVFCGVPRRRRRSGSAPRWANPTSWPRSASIFSRRTVRDVRPSMSVMSFQKEESGQQ